MHKVLLLSDVHYSVDSKVHERRWFPWVVSFIGLFSSRLPVKFLSWWDNYSQQQFEKVAQHAQNSNYELAVCLGDMTPGVNERGLVSKKAIKEARLARNSIDACADKMFYVFGNHDLGYGLGQKINMDENIVTATDVYQTEVYYSKVVHNRKFIFINSEIGQSTNYTKLLWEKQIEFLDKELEGDMMSFVYMHDVNKLKDRALSAVVAKHAEKIEKVIGGDLHSKSLGKLVRNFLPHSKKIEIISSPIGFLGYDAGFAELHIYDDRSVVLHVNI